MRPPPNDRYASDGTISPITPSYLVEELADGPSASAAMIATGTGPRGELAIIDAVARASRRSADDLIASSAATPSVATTETA
jgi:hypothetical protein